MWKNIVWPDMPQMTIWRTRIACWIPKATDTYSEYVILLVFHCNNGCTNAPQRNVIRTLDLLFCVWIVSGEQFAVRVSPVGLQSFLTVSAYRAISVSLEHLWAIFLDIARGTNRADVCHDYERAMATLLRGLGSCPRLGKRLLCTGSPILLLHRYHSLLPGAALQQVSVVPPLVRVPEWRSA